MRYRARQLLGAKSQHGMASIIVVAVLIVIMALISISFARIINRAASNSADRQFSSSATYAAQSGINDVASYLRQYVQKGYAAGGYLPHSSKCTGTGSLIGDASSKGPFYNDTNISGDQSTKYTCILLNTTPTTLQYNEIVNLKSQIVKVNTSAATSSLEKLLISWQPSNPAITGYPPALSTTSLSDETTWNTSNYTPILRLTIYPVSSGELLSSAQAQSKTVFLYPQATNNGTVPIQSFAGITDGSVMPVACNTTVAAGSFNPTTPASYKCNIIINSLSAAIAPANTDAVYLRLTPIYNQLDVQLAANDKFGDQLQFLYDQAVVDITAQTGGVAKRLQARLDISSLDVKSGGQDLNISSNSDTIPENSIRSAIAICKREVVQNYTSIGYTNYIYFDSNTPNSVCHYDTNVNNPVPTLTMSITGNNGKDNGLSVDSEANNPDSGQSPPQQATVYVGDSPASPGGNATINWTTTDASSCTATNGSSGWPGEKNGIMTFTGSPNTNGSGNQAFTNITSKTSYTLYCSRPGGPSNTATKKVTIWPHPKITNLSVNPSTIEAGSSYTISWDSINTKSDSSNPCTLSDNWSGSVAHTGFQTFIWPVNDNTSTLKYTVTCYDPVGRQDQSYITVGPNGTTCVGNGCPSSSGGPVVAPTCGASAWFSGDGTIGNTYINWATDCDYWDAGNPCQLSRHIDSNIPGIGTQDGSPCYLKNGSVQINSSGTFNFDIYVWATPWSNSGAASTYGSTVGPGLANSGLKSKTIYPPMSIDFNSTFGLWDNSPECNSPGNWWDQTWWCRISGTVPTTSSNGTSQPGVGSPSICADGIHRWTACDFWYQASGGSGNFKCGLYSSYSYKVPFMSNPSSITGVWNSNGPWGWFDSGSPNTFELGCTDNVTGQLQIIAKNIP